MKIELQKIKIKDLSSSIMDCLFTRLQQKELGAFFTPPQYAEISQKMLLDYIEEINTKREEKYLKPNGYEVIKKLFNYKELNSKLLQLRDLLRVYFNNNITHDLFKYKLIK